MDHPDKPSLSRAEQRFCQRVSKRVSKQISTAGDLFVVTMKYHDESMKLDVLEIHVCETPYEVKGGCHDGRRFSYGLVFDADHVKSVFDIPCRVAVLCLFTPHAQCDCPDTVPYVSFEGTIDGREAIVCIHLTPFPTAVPIAVVAYDELPPDLPKP